MPNRSFSACCRHINNALMISLYDKKRCPAITDIIFELGGVLINLDMYKMQQACQELGIKPELFFVKADGQNSSTVCQGLSASHIIEDYQVGQVTTEALLERILCHCRKGITRQDAIDAWNACLGDIPHERLDMIRQLRQRGYRTHLLSNTNDLHWRHIKEKFLSEEGYTCADLFDQVILSHEAHLAKPDPAIFQYALRRIAGKPEQCIFIDDAEANTVAAQAEGLNGLWLDLSKEDMIALMERTL